MCACLLCHFCFWKALYKYSLLTYLLRKSWLCVRVHQTTHVCWSVPRVTTARVRTSACVSAVTSAVSRVLAVTACSVTPANLDSSSREAAASKSAQRGEKNAHAHQVSARFFIQEHHKHPLSFSVTLATPPPWFASDVTPLVGSVGVVVTETVWVVGRTTSTWGRGGSACRAAPQATTKTAGLRPVTSVTPPARPAAVKEACHGYLVVCLCDFTAWIVVFLGCFEILELH